MPAADTSRRGTHLLEAALSVIAEEGFNALSMRTVAAAAGVSLAQVQYYFRTKNELIKAGFEYTGEQFVAGLSDLDTMEPSLRRLHEVVSRWLPLDHQRERRARVWLAYAATAAVDQELAAESARLDTELREWFRAELETLREMGELNPHLDAGTVAAQTFALIDGVTLQALAVPPAQRQALVDRAVNPFIAGLAAPGVS